MFGILASFLAGLSLATLWTQNILPATWGIRYLVGLLLAVGLWYWGASLIYNDFETPWIYLHAREIAAGIGALGFISLWVGVPLLHGLGNAAGTVGKALLFVAVPVGLLWGFGLLLQSNDPVIRDHTEEILVLSLVIGGLLLLSRFKFKPKKSGGGSSGGGGTGGAHH